MTVAAEGQQRAPTVSMRSNRAARGKRGEVGRQVAISLVRCTVGRIEGGASSLGSAMADIGRTWRQRDSVTAGGR